MVEPMASELEVVELGSSYYISEIHSISFCPILNLSITHVMPQESRNAIVEKRKGNR